MKNLIIKDVRKGIPRAMKAECVYLHYLKLAGERGQFAPDEVEFWTEQNPKLKNNPAFCPFKYAYRTK